MSTDGERSMKIQSSVPFDLDSHKKTFPLNTKEYSSLGVETGTDTPDTVYGENAKKDIGKGLLKTVVKTAFAHNRAKKELSDDDMRRGSIYLFDGSRRGSDTNRRKTVGSVKFSKVEHAALMKLAITKEVKRKGLMNKWRLLVKLYLLMKRWWYVYAVQEIGQTHPLYNQFELIRNSAPKSKDHYIHFDPSHFKADRQMRMSAEAKRILTTLPETRTAADIHYATVALRNIDSIAAYPLRMQKALATYGTFECYDAARIIVQQDHSPDGFYFILYGQVIVAGKHPESIYAKTYCHLKRSDNFGELAIAHRTKRMSTVITKEYTELLKIDSETYEKIFMAGGTKTIEDPDHHKFMRSLFFLNGWPLEAIGRTPNALQFCYFRRDVVLVRDSNFSDWIYIVKSGSLTVLKKLEKVYPTVNSRTGNYTEKAHTQGYFSFRVDETDYHRYADYNQIKLPRPLSPPRNSDSDDDSIDGTGYGDIDDIDLLAIPLLKRINLIMRPKTASATYLRINTKTFHGNSSIARRSVKSAKSDSMRKSRRSCLVSYSERRGKSVAQTTTTPSISVDSLQMKETPRDETEGLVGKRTIIDDFDSAVKSKTRETTAADLNPEFMTIQTLTKGQAFGLAQIFFEDQPSLILVSNGAECVMLSKKVYRENCSPALLEELRQEVSPYPSEEELQQALECNVNWNQYKKINIQKLVGIYMDGKNSRLKFT
ncbi:hypothetical protein CHS0354_002481 [Potamilus streckersoni]|uniref:Cyclic nucleotide-binding domain-containing protein n=1 Tax=Potamilus streckersoni TaxID=2493646 RepID=A0AAE0T8Z1_9BIVA|nr:hypothetical protein CHS0354_002481 [Potamilus streckersoni]